jgi:bacterioferritin
MRGDPEIIEFLNEALTSELTAINQYFAHAKLCENWGYLGLAAHHREESIGEMRDAETLIDRILYLEGHPNLQRMGAVKVGENVPEQMAADLALEVDAVARYNRGVQLCLAKGDAGTREILETLLSGEESHLDWIETQQRIIAEIGIERYLQSHLH